MATMNVSLPDQMKAWVEEQTKDGRYANASDYVRDLIRKDRERAEERALLLSRLQSEWDKGMESGSIGEYDADAFVKRMRDADAQIGAGGDNG